MQFCDSADDSMAILMAFHCPEVEVLGLTSVFGNAATEDATRNALLLVCASKIPLLFLAMDLLNLRYSMSCHVFGTSS